MTSIKHHFSAQALDKDFKLAQILQEWPSYRSKSFAKNTVIQRAAGLGNVYAFNFGAISFWNVSESDRQKEVEAFSNRLAVSKANQPFLEEFWVIEDPESKPKVEFNSLTIDVLTPERAEVIAQVIAQSTSMEYYENIVEQIWVKVSVLVETLRAKGKISPFPSQLYRAIGEGMSIRNDVVGVLHLLDRPDLIWNDAVMDGLYNDLRNLFELNERFAALKYRLDTIKDSLEILIDTARDQRLFLLELAIVLLFIFEIILGFRK